MGLAGFLRGSEGVVVDFCLSFAIVLSLPTLSLSLHRVDHPVERLGVGVGMKDEREKRKYKRQETKDER